MSQMADVVICGGGIIGCSVAYHLAKRGVRSLIVERAGIACAASGKAGGFLARDWSQGTDVEELSMKSFDLHMKLMEEFPNCDYRRLDTLAVTVVKDRAKKAPKNVPDWVDGSVAGASILGTKASTAQVHPYKLCHAFIDKAKELVGSQVKLGIVEGIEKVDGKVTGVNVSGELIPASTVVVTMGPWTDQAKKWLGTPGVKCQKAHSVVFRPNTEVTPHALFLECSFPSGLRSPEVYPRPDGTVYVCGMSSRESLPEDPLTIKPIAQSCEQIKKDCEQTSSRLADATVEVEQACYLPFTSHGIPLIGKVLGSEGAYIAAGHSCWGILNAPATGVALAELIVDGHCSSLDLSAFNPANFMSCT